MARPLRIEFAGAIYHVMSRGNAREGIFDDERDDARLRDGPAQTVTQYDWELLTFLFLPNHVHLFLLVELSRLCPPRPVAGLGVVGRSVFGVGTETVMATVAEYYGVSPATFQERRRGDESRDVAAWLTRRLTTAALRELARLFGLRHPGSVSNLLRRAEREVAESSRLRRVIEVIERRLIKTKYEA